MWSLPGIDTGPPFVHYIYIYIYIDINYMHKASSLQCIHYADDMTLFSKGNNLDYLIDLTNNELVKTDKWVCANKLSLNINKTAFSICSTKAVSDSEFF